LFFAGALAAHVRARVFHNIAFPLGYLALNTAALVLGVAA
ncbi:DoxX family protein, partial [Streptomyces anthocyanicus]